MTDIRTDIRPYSLEIRPPNQPGGSYQWTIRKDGKLFQRSDRHHPTEDKARSHAEGEIERLLKER
jgi:hypothetical protein